MNMQEDRSFADEEITEQQVEEYLRNHPDFFLHYTNLLAKMEIPHECGGAISLIEHQVISFRSQNKQLKNKLMELVKIAHENDQLTGRMMRLTTNLINAHDLEEVIQTLQDTLSSEFGADTISIRLFDAAEASCESFQNIYIKRSDPTLRPFESFFKANRPLCGRLHQEQLLLLYGDRAEDIHSSVLIPLGRCSELGMIAIGSMEKERFHPGMGTIFLKQMGELISCALHRHLQ